MCSGWMNSSRQNICCMSAYMSNSAIHTLGVDKWVVSWTQAFAMHIFVVATPGECLRVNADMVFFAGNTVLSISERVRGVREYVLYKSTLPLSYLKDFCEQIYEDFMRRMPLQMPNDSVKNTMAHVLFYGNSICTPCETNSINLWMPNKTGNEILQINFWDIPIIERFVATVAWFQALKQLREDGVPTVWVNKWIVAMLHSCAPINVHLPCWPWHTEVHRYIIGTQWYANGIS